MIRKTYAADMVQMGERQVRVICSTDVVDRGGEIIDQAGIDLSEFNANPILLWQHNPEHPIGTVPQASLASGKLEALTEFAPLGISQKADEICGLAKAGIIKSVSIGFDPIEMEPMNPTKPKGPQRYKKIMLYELSFVSIPANPEAVVVQRAKPEKKAADWKCGADRDLPAGDDGEWDGPAASSRLLDAATEDDEIDEDKAKAGFLAYDSANPHLRGSYKLPFADIVDGKMKAMPAAIRAAASRLPDTDISEEAKEAAAAVIKHYEEEMKIGDDTEKAKRRLVGKQLRRKGVSARKRGGALVIKDLYDVGCLLYMLDSLGWAVERSRIETALEGDGSDQADVLHAVMQELGDAILDIAKEEIAEAIAEAAGSIGEEEDDDLDDLPEVDAVIVMAGKTPASRRFLEGFFRTKAVAVTKEGRTISSDTAATLSEAIDHANDAMDLHRQAMASHRLSVKCMESLMPDGDAEGKIPDEEPDPTQTGEDENESEKSRRNLTSKVARLRLVKSLAKAS